MSKNVEEFLTLMIFVFFFLSITFHINSAKVPTFSPYAILHEKHNQMKLSY